MAPKLPSVDGYDAFCWVGHPQCDAQGEQERKIIARRDDVLFHGGVQDNEASYSYDDWALIELDGDFYLLGTSGCSCPSPSETWHVQKGPATIDQIREDLLSDKYEGYSVPKRQMAEFIAIIDRAKLDKGMKL